MTDQFDLTLEGKRSLGRIEPRLEIKFQAEIQADPNRWQDFRERLHHNFQDLFARYLDLYSTRYDFFYHLEDLVFSLAHAWFERPGELRRLDEIREANPLWFQSNQVVGGVCYVDLFAGNLQGVRAKIPYFKELGLTYLHLMPFFKTPSDENDGGYAVSSYREVNPSLGSMKELPLLARDLRTAGISLSVDLVFNHTSDEHLWAQRAKAGDAEYQDYYRLFPNRTMPDAYERYLREIFPEEHSGAFTFQSKMNKWVWTTFHRYQWDLNYDNPSVFNRMTEEMLFLANQGVEVLRLDAVAFIWKRLGTNCENLPGAHTLIQALNAAARIAAPALSFNSEAIVHPDEVVKYIGPQECQLSYNPLVMALLWESLATRKVQLLRQALTYRFNIDPACTWVNYVRCHDDIGWTFSDEDAGRLGINAFDHRRFLNEFYRGRFEGSFARGLPFQENPKTGDCRISGTCASLAGLEKAVHEEGPNEIELAIRRILLIHGVILTAGGIPLLYLGDEVATLNDYQYRKKTAHAEDSRWVHRPRADWDRFEHRVDITTLEGRLYHGLQELIQLRKAHKGFSGGDLRTIFTGNDHFLAYERTHDGERMIILANFSEEEQRIAPDVSRACGIFPGAKPLHGKLRFEEDDLILEPLDFCALRVS